MIAAQAPFPTVKWSHVSKSALSEDARAEHLARLEAVLIRLATIPPGPLSVTLDRAPVTITDPQKFVTGHTGRVRGFAGKPLLCLPYLGRLEQFARYLETIAK